MNYNLLIILSDFIVNGLRIAAPIAKLLIINMACTILILNLAELKCESNFLPTHQNVFISITFYVNHNSQSINLHQRKCIEAVHCMHAQAIA
jgi:hypothetical protein